ncbi:MAG: serine protease [Magnetospirillum sp.]|nr:MAG: serine protease [Magnetospirillum sp.]
MRAHTSVRGCLFVLAMVVSGPSLAAPPAAAFDEARALIEAEQFDQALGVLKSIEADDRASQGRIATMVGRIWLALGKPARALEFFEQSEMTSVDDDGEALLGAAEAELALGRLASARRHASAALKADGDLVAAHLVLARVDQRLGNADTAQARLRSLARDQPDSEEVAVVLARWQATSEGPLAAVTSLEGFIRRNPAAATVREQVSRLLWAGGRKVEAVREALAAASIYLDRGRVGRVAAIGAWLQAVDPTEELQRKAEAEPTLPEPPAAPPPAMAQPQAPQPAAPAPARRGVTAAVLPQPETLPFSPGSQIMTGSGVVIEGGRQVVTNRHVVEGMHKVAVRNGTGHVRNARILRVSSDDDLALLEITEPFPEDSVTALTDIVEAGPGRPAIVMGFPLINIFGDEQPALTEGIVAKAVGLGNDPNTFQMTSKINKGNSGGPVFDRRGQLIGLTVAKVDVAGIFETRGILVEDMNIGIKAGRILRFLGRPSSAPESKGGAELDLEDLYQLMLPRVVLVAAQP